MQKELHGNAYTLVHSLCLGFFFPGVWTYALPVMNWIEFVPVVTVN